MNYKSGLKVNDFEKALGLSKAQVERLKNAIQKAYDSLPGDDFNIDEINGIVAPYIKTPEEAYFVGCTILGDVLGGYINMLKKQISELS